MDEETLFHLALEKPAAERNAFLRQACGGDEALRLRVQTLLEAHDEPVSFLDPSKGTSGLLEASLQISAAGTVIGRYRILEPIGEGGYGTVFVAEQTTPVQRQVALKIIKAGMDTKQVIARFEAERQALALMDHPNIAKVFDAGITEGGRPYFVMELVKGMSITKYCDEHRLGLGQRLELLVQVCQAVQHAHQKGIIHRDIKPSNVLIAQYDGKAVPKVIDFGVAKATGPRLTEATMFTGFGDVIGTPQYMSPEQAELNQLDVDTRSDIYSLGVLLYELLTGTTPLESRRVKEAALLEVLRIIREEEPPRPSTRLTSAEALPSIAAQRGLEPRTLSGIVKGELDWIVMKALEKDRSRRYETANGLAMDLRRYLADEPVQACPPSALYRFRKFTRRNRAAVLTAAAMLVVLLAGIAGTTFGLIRAERRRADADQARANEAAQRQAADTEKKRAEKAEADTLADYRASTDDAIQQLIGSKPRLGTQEKAYLEKTLKRWQAFASRQGNDDRSLAIRAEGHQSVAYLWGVLGQREKARAEYEAARDLYKKLVDSSPGGSQYEPNLANAHHNMGVQLAELGKRDAARTEYETARDVYKKLADASPADPKYQRALASSYNALGNLLSNLGQFDAALKEYESARDLRQKLADGFPTETHQNDLAGAHLSLGGLLHQKEQYEAARTEYETARALYKKLNAAAPDSIAYQQGLAAVQVGLGNLLKQLKQPEKARTEYVAAREIYKKLADAYPAISQFQQALAAAQGNLSVLLQTMDGQRNAASVELKATISLNKKIAAAFPAEPENQISLGGSYCNYGNFLREDKQPAESLVWFDLAIRTLTPVYEQDRRDAKAKEFLHHSYVGRALTYDQLKNHAKATKDWDKVAELDPTNPETRCAQGRGLIDRNMLEEAVAAFHKAIEVNPKYGAGYYGLGQALYAQDKLDDALAAFRKAVELEPKHPSPHIAVGWVLKRKGKLEEAIASYRTAIALDPQDARTADDLALILATAPDARLRDPKYAVMLAKKAVATAPKEASYWHTLGIAHYRAGQWQDALGALKKSNQLFKKEMPGNGFFLAMLYWRVGAKVESRRCYDVAVARMEKNNPENLPLKRYRAEAMELMGIEDKKTTGGEATPASSFLTAPATPGVRSARRCLSIHLPQTRTEES